MYEWRRVYGAPPTRMSLTVLEPGCCAVEHLDPSDVDDAAAYLVLATLDNRILGTLRRGELLLDDSGPPPGTTACTLYRAAEA